MAHDVNVAIYQNGHGNEFPAILFQSTEVWGASFIFTEEQAEEAADSLQDGVADYSDDEYSIDDCERLFFVQVVDDDSALYRHQGGQGYLIKTDGADYELVKSFPNPEDFCPVCKGSKFRCDC